MRELELAVVCLILGIGLAGCIEPEVPLDAAEVDQGAIEEKIPYDAAGSFTTGAGVCTSERQAGVNTCDGGIRLREVTPRGTVREASLTLTWDARSPTMEELGLTLAWACEEEAGCRTASAYGESPVKLTVVDLEEDRRLRVRVWTEPTGTEEAHVDSRYAQTVEVTGTFTSLVPPGAQAGGGGDPEEEQNPWQAGLDDEYSTPAVAKERSKEDRRDNVSPPGDMEFAAFDASIQAWMQTHQIPAGQVAIMQNGELLYTNGYGHTDRDESRPTDPGTMFRIASVTKPMTAALVTLQVDQGLYNLTDPVFCVPPDPAPNCRLPIDPHPSNPIADDRLEDVEVHHLLDHTSGLSGDWMLFSPGPIQVADALDLGPPPPAWRTAQFLMGENLTADPGSQRAYCNVCYMLAGLVAEAATGAELGALYDAYLFRPLDVEGDIEPGYTLPKKRNAREPFYACDAGAFETGEAPSVYDPGKTVCKPEGFFALEDAGLAPFGLVSTAEAVAAVYEAYGDLVPVKSPLGMGEARIGPFEWRGHTGGLAGTATMAGTVEDEDTVTGEAHYVALFNSRKHCTGLTRCSVYHLEGALTPLATLWGGTGETHTATDRPGSNPADG